MADLLKGLIGASSSYVLGWVLPLAFASLTFIYVVLIPSGAELGQKLVSADPATLIVVSTLTLLSGGLIMSSLAPQLYRLLEGYSWPGFLRAWGRRRQVARKQKLLEQMESASTDLDRALIAEQVDRFPVDPQQMAPTRFGNAMRAFETFGLDRFALDSQAFWVELTSVVPDSLRSELGRSRAAVDFYVAQVFLAGAFAIMAGTIYVRETPRYLPAGVACLISAALIPLFYRSAVMSTTYWHSTVRALVNLGRHEFARQLGLTVPKNLADERHMWQQLAAYNYYPFDEAWVDLLDDYRQGCEQASSGGDSKPDDKLSAWARAKRIVAAAVRHARSP